MALHCVFHNDLECGTGQHMSNKQWMVGDARWNPRERQRVEEQFRRFVRTPSNPLGRIQRQPCPFCLREVKKNVNQVPEAAASTRTTARLPAVPPLPQKAMSLRVSSKGHSAGRKLQGSGQRGTGGHGKAQGRHHSGRSSEQRSPSSSLRRVQDTETAFGSRELWKFLTQLSEFHHLDYKNPFLGVWCCFSHHRKIEHGSVTVWKRDIWDYHSVVAPFLRKRIVGLPSSEANAA